MDTPPKENDNDTSFESIVEHHPLEIQQQSPQQQPAVVASNTSDIYLHLSGRKSVNVDPTSGANNNESFQIYAGDSFSQAPQNESFSFHQQQPRHIVGHNNNDDDDDENNLTAAPIVTRPDVQLLQLETHLRRGDNGIDELQLVPVPIGRVAFPSIFCGLLGVLLTVLLATNVRHRQKHGSGAWAVPVVCGVFALLFLCFAKTRILIFDRNAKTISWRETRTVFSTMSFCTRSVEVPFDAIKRVSAQYDHSSLHSGRENRVVSVIVIEAAHPDVQTIPTEFSDGSNARMKIDSWVNYLRDDCGIEQVVAA